MSLDSRYLLDPQSPGGSRPLGSRQAELGRDRQQPDQDSPHDQLAVVLLGEPVDDEAAQTTPGHEGPEGGSGDHLDEGDADPFHDQGHRQRELHPGEDLALGEAHPSGRLQGRWLHGLDPGHGVGEHRGRCQGDQGYEDRPRLPDSGPDLDE